MYLGRFFYWFKYYLSFSGYEQVIPDQVLVISVLEDYMKEYIGDK